MAYIQLLTTDGRRILWDTDHLDNVSGFEGSYKTGPSKIVPPFKNCRIVFVEESPQEIDKLKGISDY